MLVNYDGRQIFCNFSINNIVYDSIGTFEFMGIDFLYNDSNLKNKFGIKDGDIYFNYNFSTKKTEMLVGEDIYDVCFECDELIECLQFIIEFIYMEIHMK